MLHVPHAPCLSSIVRRSHMRSLKIHILPAVVTMAVFVLAPLIFTLPMVAVFVIDKEFVVSDYVKLVALLCGIAAATVALLIAPLALLIDLRWRHPRSLALIFPFLPAPALICLAGFRKLVLHIPLQEVVEGWNGIACAAAILLGVYWTVLLAEKALLRILRGCARGAPNKPLQATAVPPSC